MTTSNLTPVRLASSLTLNAANRTAFSRRHTRDARDTRGPYNLTQREV